jgi:O-antigen/teichoic acid export membrane protein
MMVTLTVEKGGAVPVAGPRMTQATGLALRVIGAALQILTNVAIVRVLPPGVAGIYFKGAVIAYGLSAMLRGKYDLFVAHCFIGQAELGCGVPRRALVRGLGIRVLIRSAIACALLLVFTSDLDVVSPHFRPYLETYLPFVLAVPFATLALFLARALGSVNRTLGGIVVSNYSMNLVILIAATAVSGTTPENGLFVLSWAYLVGASLAALLGVVITRRVFEVQAVPPNVDTKAAWGRIYTASASHGLSGLATAALQWGPLCVLAVLAPAVQVAEYAIVSRTAQIVDFLIPAIVIIPQGVRLKSRWARAMRTPRGQLAVDLAMSLATASLCVLVVSILTPWITSLYGPPYTHLTALFVLLLAMQWVGGACRPAVRHLAADWNLNRIRWVLLVSAAAAVIPALLGVPDYGPVAAAAGALAGVVVENGLALASAFRYARSRHV